MENATKALLIAAGVMIGVILISLFTYFYSNAISMQASYETTLETNRINKINTAFTKYNGRKDLTAQDIVTIYNLAQEYWQTDGIYINIEVDGITISSIEDDFIKNNSTGSITSDDGSANITYIKHYQATVSLKNGLVDQVTFNEVEEEPA